MKWRGVLAQALPRTSGILTKLHDQLRQQLFDQGKHKRCLTDATVEAATKTKMEVAQPQHPFMTPDAKKAKQWEEDSDEEEEIVPLSVMAARACDGER